jgi:putative glutamine amidotransferase
MPRPKLFVPDFESYATPFLPIFDLTENLAIADVVMFTGGADIDPKFYGEPQGKRTYLSNSRDIREKHLFDVSSARGKKFLGICRGAQFLCAMAGGKLAQHIEGHSIGFRSYHRITTSEGGEYRVNSVHHQMMLPPPGSKLLAWAEKLSDIYLDGNDKHIEGIETEPEVVYFPQVKGLGIQCHPEAMDRNGDTMKYFHKLVKEHLL